MLPIITQIVLFFEFSYQNLKVFFIPGRRGQIKFLQIVQVSNLVVLIPLEVLEKNIVKVKGSDKGNPT